MERQLILRLAEGDRRVVRLTGPIYVVGRDAACQIRVNDPSLSRKHARLLISEAQCTVEDLRSSNGTFVNNEKIADRVLMDGDSIRFGRIEATYEQEEPCDLDSAQDRKAGGLREIDSAGDDGILRGYLEGKPSAAVDAPALRARVAKVAARAGLDWRRKLVLSTAGTILVGGILVGGVLHWQSRDEWVGQAVNTLRPFAADNRFVLEMGLESAERLSGAIVGGDPRIVNPLVLSPDGTMLWPEETAGMIWHSWPTAELDYREDFYRLGSAPGAPKTREQFLLPVRSRGKHLGWVAAEWDRQEAGNLGSPWAVIFVSIGFLALLSYVVYEGTASWISRPLKAISEELRSTPSAERLQLAPPADVPELIELATAVQIAMEAKRTAAQHASGATQPTDLGKWVEGLPVPLLLLDEGYRIIASNPEAVRLLGLRKSSGESIGQLLGGVFFGVAIIRLLKSCPPGQMKQEVIDLGPEGSSVRTAAMVSRPLAPESFAVALAVVPIK